MEKRPFTFDEAEYRIRRLLAEEGYAQPDEVRKGPGEQEITFAWNGHDHPITMDLSECPEPIDRIEQPIAGRPATVAEVTAQMCKLIGDEGMRMPDEIRPGPEPWEVGFIWAEEKLVVIVDGREEVAFELPEPGRAA